MTTVITAEKQHAPPKCTVIMTTTNKIIISKRIHKTHTEKQVRNLTFYAQSTSTVISGRHCKAKLTLCGAASAWKHPFNASQLFKPCPANRLWSILPHTWRVLLLDRDCVHATKLTDFQWSVKCIMNDPNFSILIPFFLSFKDPEHTATWVTLDWF